MKKRKTQFDKSDYTFKLRDIFLFRNVDRKILLIVLRLYETDFDFKGLILARSLREISQSIVPPPPHE